MCRWFAYISATEESLLEDVLITPRHSLIRQVDSHYLPDLFHYSPDTPDAEKEAAARNRMCNLDGFGVAWYNTTRSRFTAATSDDELRPVCYRTVVPPLHDLVFQSICANTSSKVCFGHVRASSGTAVATTNNHPFTFGRHIFMHNGTVDQFPAIKKGLVQIIGNDEYNNIAGGTDSEHLAALYMTYLSNGEGKEGWERRYGVDEMYKALLRAMGSAIKLQEQILGSRAQPNSLNIAVTDGLQLVAVRFRNHPTEQPPSLYYSTKAGVTLNRKYPGHANGAEVENLNASLEGSQHGEHLIVSSEPTTYDEKEWKLIEKNHAVVWSDGSGVVTLSIDH